MRRSRSKRAQLLVSGLMVVMIAGLMAGQASDARVLPRARPQLLLDEGRLADRPWAASLRRSGSKPCLEVVIGRRSSEICGSLHPLIASGDVVGSGNRAIEVLAIVGPGSIRKIHLNFVDREDMQVATSRISVQRTKEMGFTEPLAFVVVPLRHSACLERYVTYGRMGTRLSRSERFSCSASGP